MDIQLYKHRKKTSLPTTLNLSNHQQLLYFASKILHYKQKRLKVVVLQKYIIIHFEDKKFLQQHPDWEEKKYIEALVIHKNSRNYVAFSFARS